MPTLRSLQATWNSLVPQANSLGIRVRRLRSTHETIVQGTARVEWLRRQIALRSGTALQSPVAQVATGELTFGVEIECLIPEARLAECLEAIRAAGVAINIEGYNHFTRASWKVVTDGSVGVGRRAGFIGREIVSPVLSGQAGIIEVAKVCEALVKHGAEVNRSCGLHVHVGNLGSDDQLFNNLFAGYATHQATIDTFMSPSRRGTSNMYCAPVPVHSFTGGIIGVQSRMGGRYWKLNPAAYSRYRTVEFRHHNGTVEATKACAWVRFCLAMVRAARAGSLGTACDLSALCERLDLDAADTQFFLGRARHFAGQTTQAAA